MPKIEEFYPLIGKLVVDFQHVDFCLNLLLAGLLREDPNVSMAFIVSLPFKKKIDVIKCIAPLRFNAPDLHANLDELIKKLSKAEEARNRIVHTSWMGSIDGNKVFTHKPGTSRKKGMYNGGIQEIEIAEVVDTISIVEQTRGDIIRFGELLQKRNISTFNAFNKKPEGDRT